MSQGGFSQTQCPQMQQVGEAGQCPAQDRDSTARGQQSVTALILDTSLLPDGHYWARPSVGGI